MAFAVHINKEHCTGCNNCVVACPVDASELNPVDHALREEIYVIWDEKSIVLDPEKLCAGCGVCVQACPYGVIRLASPWESRSVANVQ